MWSNGLPGTQLNYIPSFISTPGSVGAQDPVLARDTNMLPYKSSFYLPSVTPWRPILKMAVVQMEVLKTKWLRFSSHLWRRAAQGSCPWTNIHFGLGVNEKQILGQVTEILKLLITAASTLLRQILLNYIIQNCIGILMGGSASYPGPLGKGLWLSEKDTGVNGALSQHQSNLTLGAWWIVTFCPCKNREAHTVSSSQPYISLMKTFLTQFVLITKPSSLHFDSITQSTFPNLWRWTLQ